MRGEFSVPLCDGFPPAASQIARVETVVHSKL